MSLFRCLKHFKITSIALLMGFSAWGADDKKAEDFPPMPQVPALSPEETSKLFLLPDGYRMEPVLTDPNIKEPVMIAFDGNGRMFVCEMRSYMQEIDGKDEHTPVGLISRHESSKGDGIYDKHTIFADKLTLPRMVLPLDERVLINETDTSDIRVLKDTNGDGKADEDKVIFEGGKRGGNLEHQPSGLIWCMDNWIYTAGNSYRLRWNKGEPLLRDETQGNGGQWGLSQDDFGKPWFSNGGGERGFVTFQLHCKYSSINPAEQSPPEFLAVYPATHIPDVQGGPSRVWPETHNLNHMTATCGNVIFRGDRLPEDLRGDPLVCEPVGRLIRRAKIDSSSGLLVLKNPYEKSEFIRSTDPNFRPVNMTTGPDGCLYICDMYRGIIQEGNWTREGSYLRKVIQQYGLDKNVSRGRIWRLVHKDFQPGPQPHMLDETPAQLVKHLEHPNGWWRDTAQQLLVMRGDTSVVPALTEMARTNANPLARLHALWALEGLGGINAQLVREKMKDEHPQVRVAAIRLSEALIKAGDQFLQQDVVAMERDKDGDVCVQSLLTAKIMNWPSYRTELIKMIGMHPSKRVKEIGKALLNATIPEIPKDQFSDADYKLYKHGGDIYRELCFSCHGYDGKGMPISLPGGGEGLMAPPLSGSKTLMSDRLAGAHVLLHGLTGLVDGKKYDAQMIPMGSNPDEWIASAVTYARNAFGNRGTALKVEDVKKIRDDNKDRKTPWTIEEIMARVPHPLTNVKEWKLSANTNPKSLPNMIDNDLDTRYDTGTGQAPGQWIQIDLPEVTKICGLIMDPGKSPGDWPRGYKIEFSKDGKEWGAKPFKEGKGSPAAREFSFNPMDVKSIKVTQTGEAKGTFWSIHEFKVIVPVDTKAAAGPAPAAPAATAAAGTTAK